MYTVALCFVGRDIEYSVNAVSAVVDSGFRILAIVGVTAEEVARAPNISAALACDNGLVISAAKPWESPAMHSLNLTNALGVSCGFDYIIPETVLAKLAVVNAHPSFLPLNKGCHQSFWSIMNGEPFGASLHWVTAKLDDGPVIAQVFFPDEPRYTAGCAQKQSLALCVFLLRHWLPKIKNGQTVVGGASGGSYHAKSEIKSASTIAEHDKTPTEQLLRLCRATAAKNNGFKIFYQNKIYTIVIKEIIEEDKGKTRVLPG